MAERWWEVSLVDDDEEAVGRGWDAWYVVGLTTPMLRPGHKKPPVWHRRGRFELSYDSIPSRRGDNGHGGDDDHGDVDGGNCHKRFTEEDHVTGLEKGELGNSWQGRDPTIYERVESKS